jgi:hypothetical protein
MSEDLTPSVGAIDIYRGRRAVLATRHGKEQAVAPAFLDALGLDVIVPEGLDTDSLGTFTGEVARTGSMRETALRKARMGMSAAGLPLAIASEGSFGPHPVIPFLPAGHEVLVFIDAERGFEIFEEQLTEQTNYAALDVTPGVDIEAFLLQAGFPQHALVVRTGETVTKGVTSRDDLERLLAGESPVHLATDMRAHMNPTRMAAIMQLAGRLARRVAAACPSCGAPGFGTLRAVRGLPCEDCGAPTQLVDHVVDGCALCLHELSRPRPDGRLTATPAECPECNP